MSSINFGEVLARLADLDVPLDVAWSRTQTLPFQVVGHDEVDAALTAALRPASRAAGLGVADRACLAAGIRHDALVVTADRAWADLDVPVDVHVIR